MQNAVENISATPFRELQAKYSLLEHELPSYSTIAQ
jgi:hypothetical protein